MKKTSVADRILERLEGFAEALQSGANIQKRFTCRKVALDLKPLPYTPEVVRSIRESLNASQALFAQLLGVSPKTVQAWEQGKTEPSPMACRWLDEIKRNPGYWQDRLKQAMVARDSSKRPRRVPPAGPSRRVRRAKEAKA
jgi:putative transcriptional regulator